MRLLLVSLLTLLLGLILGGLGPKADLRKARDEINQLKKQPRAPSSNANLDGIASMLRIPESDAKTRHAVTLTPPTNHVASPVLESTVRHPPPRIGDEDTPPRPNPQTLQERLRTASDAWKIRADLARSGFISNVTTSEVQAGQFDLAVADMNLRLSTAIRNWVDTIKEQPEFTPENGIRMMNALSSELVQTYDQLDTTMPPDWRQHAGDKFQVFDLIDPQVAMPLTELEGKMPFHARHPAPEGP